MTGVALSSLTFWLVFKLSFFYLDIGPMNHKDLYVRDISKAQTCIFGFVCQRVNKTLSLFKVSWNCSGQILSYRLVMCSVYAILGQPSYMDVRLAIYTCILVYRIKAFVINVLNLSIKHWMSSWYYVKPRKKVRYCGPKNYNSFCLIINELLVNFAFHYPH